ncbi:MAG: FkbM family methyltransferase [Candidatus Acidiferrales bacterium]
MSLSRESVFDSPDAIQIVEARQAAVRPLLTDLRQKLGIRTAVDVGCGVGRFSSFLQHLGFEVVGIDGREVNVAEARRRQAGVEFHHVNVEDESVLRLGSFDLVFCMGLLYHLENPLLAIRRLRALTQKGLLLESMCIPDDRSSLLLRTELPLENQSLTDMAFYPSEGCLVKMLYRAGFTAVYRLASLPDHDDFRETPEHLQRRTVLLASVIPLASSLLIPLSEPHETVNPWQKTSGGVARFSRRVKKFLSRSAGEKYLAVGQRMRRILPNMPIPLRLPFGAWFLARSDYMGAAVTYGGFELAERAFVSRFLRPGMTVLDIGAHHGLYTLLASKAVGPSGHVFAFEPSPRERKALRLNVGLNRCKNVGIQELALGNEEGEASLHVVDHLETGCNSLRPPALVGSTSLISVRVLSLDQWLAAHDLQSVDFIKLDVEGGELSVLQGAQRLLERRPRPVILAEVQDIRTQPWGYRGREIIDFLSGKGYKWFRMSAEGSLEELHANRQDFDENFVAWPGELDGELLKMQFSHGHHSNHTSGRA